MLRVVIDTNIWIRTLIHGRANAIVSGDADLRDDDKLRKEMKSYGIEIWGVDSLLKNIPPG